MSRVKIVPRAAFPVPLKSPWCGGEATWHFMSGRCWGGRTGALLIAWDEAQYERDLCRVSPAYRAAATWGGLL